MTATSGGAQQTPPLVAEVARRRANLTELRRILAERRAAGLAARHAAKLSRYPMNPTPERPTP